MKKQSINLFVLAAIFAFSVSVLSGCSSSSESTTSNTDSDSGQDSEAVAEIEEAADETADEAASDMFIALVNSVDEETISLTEYETESDEVDYLSVDLESLILSDSTITLENLEKYTIFMVLDGEEEESSLDELIPGAIVAVVEESESAGKILILKQGAAEEASDISMEYTLAEITAISDEQILSMSIYALKADYTDFIAEDFSSIDLDFYEDTFEEIQYEIPENSSIQIVEDGELRDGDISEISVGDMLLYYIAEDGSNTIFLYPAETITANE